MGVFDNIIKIDENGNILENKWIEWVHFLIPNKMNIIREIMKKVMSFFWSLFDLYFY